MYSVRSWHGRLNTSMCLPSLARGKGEGTGGALPGSGWPRGGSQEGTAPELTMSTSYETGWLQVWPTAQASIEPLPAGAVDHQAGRSCRRCR